VSSLSLTHKHTQDTQSLTHPRSFTCVNGFTHSLVTQNICKAFFYSKCDYNGRKLGQILGFCK
jgi:hypothetical protein